MPGTKTFVNEHILQFLNYIIFKYINKINFYTSLKNYLVQKIRKKKIVQKVVMKMRSQMKMIAYLKRKNLKMQIKDPQKRRNMFGY